MKIYCLSPVRRVGGSGSELLSLVSLFLSKGIEIELVCGLCGDTPTIERCKSLGATTRDWPQNQDWSFLSGQVVLAHGNPNFIMQLPMMLRHKPSRVIYISPMWIPSDIEITALNQGQITDLVHVSNAQREYHKTIYQSKGIQNLPIREGYKPYLNPQMQDLEFFYKEPTDQFVLGRVSRPDVAKFPKDLWKTYQQIKTPKAKRIFINSFDQNVANKVGNIPEGLDVLLYRPYEIDINDFLAKCHMIFQQNDNSGESFGRYILEAMYSGIPLVLESGWALNEIGEPGVHYLAGKTTEDMIGLASNLAHNPQQMKEMSTQAHLHLLQTFASQDYCYEFWHNLLA